jgi:hypothetical protein
MRSSVRPAAAVLGIFSLDVSAISQTSKGTQQANPAECHRWRRERLKDATDEIQMEIGFGAFFLP